MAIESHPLVRRWVRNLDSDPVCGFWLPTSFGRFYADFVCELTDGRLFVAEYTGEHLRSMPWSSGIALTATAVRQSPGPESPTCAVAS